MAPRPSSFDAPGDGPEVVAPPPEPTPSLVEAAPSTPEALGADEVAPSVPDVEPTGRDESLVRARWIAHETVMTVDDNGTPQRVDHGDPIVVRAWEIAERPTQLAPWDDRWVAPDPST